MKTKNLILLIAVMGLFLVSGCKKDKDETAVTADTQAQLNGVWVTPTKAADNCIYTFTFTANKLNFIAICEDITSSESHDILDYKLDDKTITGYVLDEESKRIDIKIVITELTSTNLSIDVISTNDGKERTFSLKLTKQ